MTGHRSVYPSLIPGIRKSPSVNVELGIEMEEVEGSYQMRDKSVAGRLTGLYDKLRTRKQNK